MKKIMIFLQFFFLELLRKFDDFVIYDYCIGKIISKSIRTYPVFIKKKDLKLLKNRLILLKKKRYLSNYIYD